MVHFDDERKIEGFNLFTHVVPSCTRARHADKRRTNGLVTNSAAESTHASGWMA